MSHHPTGPAPPERPLRPTLSLLITASPRRTQARGATVLPPAPARADAVSIHRPPGGTRRAEPCGPQSRYTRASRGHSTISTGGTTRRARGGRTRPAGTAQQDDRVADEVRVSRSRKDEQELQPECSRTSARFRPRHANSPPNDGRTCHPGTKPCTPGPSVLRKPPRVVDFSTLKHVVVGFLRRLTPSRYTALRAALDERSPPGLNTDTPALRAGTRRARVGRTRPAGPGPAG